MEVFDGPDSGVHVYVPKANVIDFKEEEVVVKDEVVLQDERWGMVVPPEGLWEMSVDLVEVTNEDGAEIGGSIIVASGDEVIIWGDHPDDSSVRFSYIIILIKIIQIV